LIILYYIAYLFFLILRIVPISISVTFAKGLAYLSYYADKRHREVCCKNINLAFGEEVDKKTIREISIGAYNNLFLSMLEFGRYALMPKEDLLKNITFKNKESYLEAKEKGKGVIFLTGHFSSWEIMALGGSIVRPMTIVVRPLDNHVLNKLLLKFRTKYGNNIIPKKNALRESMRTLKRGGIVGFLMDQNTSPEEGMFVPFFGTMASTVRAPIEIAVRTGATLLPTFIERVSPGKFIIDYGKPIKIGGCSSHKENVEDALIKFNKVLEGKIREHPEQWFWMHRRWKVRPPGEKKIY